MVVYASYTTEQALVPLINTKPFTAPQLQFMIYVGAYVVLNGNYTLNQKFKNEDGNVVVKVISYDPNTDVLHGNVLMDLSNVVDDVYRTDSLGNNIQPIDTGLAAGITEVVTSTNYVVAKPENIVDICFVFHMDDVDNGLVNGQGIRNCYLCRFHYISTQSDDKFLHPIENHESSFPSELREYKGLDSKDCTSSILWYRLSDLQDDVFRALNRWGGQQPNKYKLKFPFGNILWAYIKHCTKGVVEETTLSSRGYCRPMTTKGIRRQTVRARRPKPSTMLRFENYDQLNCLRRILGNSITLGVRKRKPKLGESDIVQPLTTINIIIGNNGEAGNNNGRVVTKIDFVNNLKDPHIMLYYDDYTFSRNSKKLVNRDDENIIENEFIKYMLISHF